jgi:hypothetical protein
LSTSSPTTPNREQHAVTRQLTHRTPPLIHHWMRAVGIALAAVAIAVGAYAVTGPLGPNARSPQPAGATAPARAIPSAQAMHENRVAPVGLYGDPAIASANATRETRDATVGLYGDPAIASANATREMRNTTNDYGRAH